MRIIAGEWKGRRLSGAEDLRPTGDLVRGALLSILGGSLTGTFVDLYSGTGAVGLEARSRGARAFLVERDPEALAAIRANMEVVDARSGVTVIEADVLRFLKDPAAAGCRSLPADHVFADPPYDYHSHDKLLRVLGTSPLVGPETIVVIERRKGTRVRNVDTLEQIREEVYGTSMLTFYRRPRVQPDFGGRECPLRTPEGDAEDAILDRC